MELGISFRDPYCYSCKKRGHDEENCPEPKPDYNFQPTHDFGGVDSSDRSSIPDFTSGNEGESVSLTERVLVGMIPLIILGLLGYTFLL